MIHNSSGYSHNVPDDTGAVRAGRHALFVITLDFDTCDGAPVLFHGLQQLMTFRLQFPDANLKGTQNSNVTHSFSQDLKARKCLDALIEIPINRCETMKGKWAKSQKFPLFVLVSPRVLLMGLMCCHRAFFTHHPFSSSANDPLAVPGTSNGHHTHVVRIVNDKHEATTLWCEDSNLPVIPCWKRVKSILSSHLSTKKKLAMQQHLWDLNHISH